MCNTIDSKEEIEGSRATPYSDREIKQNIIEMGKFSFQLEVDRERSIREQSSQLLVGVSLFSAALCLLLPVLLNLTPDHSALIIEVFSISGVFISISLMAAIMTLWRYRYYTLSDVSEHAWSYESQKDLYIYHGYYHDWVDQLSKAQSELRTKNDKRSNLAKVSIIAIMIAITVPAVLLFMFIIS